MENFTPGSALTGGALIGLGASILLFFTGRVAGISGILGGMLRPQRGEWAWRAAFVAGLLLGGCAVAAFLPARLGVPLRPLGILVVAGLLVGIGSRLGRGCTSGHGICGLSRPSMRSLVATVTFMATGVGAATAIRLIGNLRP